MVLQKTRNENGINVSQAGVGHEMILVLNDTMQIVVNQYFTSTDDYTNGILKYNFGKLPAGQYSVKLKVWDTHNNSTEEALRFIVENVGLKILKAYNYPNPIENSTNFYIEHNAENQDLTFTLVIFDSAGKQVFNQTETCYLCDNYFNLGMKIEPKCWKSGTYFYRISVDSISENSTSSFSGK
jgi:hypothetical protein